MKVNGFTDEKTEETRKQEEAKWGSSTIRDLELPDAITVNETITCAEVLETLSKGGFDQVPVVDNNKSLVGLVTVGNLLSKIAKGRVQATDPVSNAMFVFNKKRTFQEITEDTKLVDLQKFFEKNSNAVVTAKDSTGKHFVKKIATKVDLLKYLVKKGTN